jgi:glucuronate isomerase
MQASLETEALLPRNILKQVKTEVVVTTDDPIDDLRFQKALAEEEKAFKVIPAWRPDRLFNIFTKDYIDYIAKLSQVSEIAIANLDDLLGAIIKRLDYFQAAGASISDHGLEVFYYAPATAAEVDEIFQERLAGERLTSKQIAQFHTYIQKFLAKEYAKRNWVMQMHISAFRNLNTPAFQRTGINTGHDALNDLNIAQNVANFFDALEIEGDQAGEDYVPRTILYSLNENDYVPLLAIGATHLQGLKGAGAFQKFQLGSAWWFNDTREGMRRQLTKFMEGTLLGNFVGMLTDSRSLLSYTRHEYFRRVLCELLGELEARGQIPNALNLIGPLVENVSHHNAKQFFNV